MRNSVYFSIKKLREKAKNYVKNGCFTLIYEDFRAVIQEK